MSVNGPTGGRRVGSARSVVALVGALAASALVAPAAAAPSLDRPTDLAGDGTSQLATGTTSVEPAPHDTTVLAADVDRTAPDGEELAETVEAAVEAVGGEVRVEDPSSGLISVEVPQDAAEDVEQVLQDLPAVEEVSTPALFETMRLPRDPQVRRQRGYLRQITVPRAWNRTRGSDRVTVAVVDTGVRTDHPDLRGKVAARHNSAYGTRAVRDRDGHGTAVASIIAANTNNRKGIAGVGWRTRLLVVKAADRNGRLWGDAIADGIRWAVRNGADVINLSLGSSIDDPWVRGAVRFAQRRNVLVVAAVSNAGSTEAVYPAAYPGVLGVGATQGAGLAPFSDRGEHVDVAAPGLGLRAAVPWGYATVDGTSFAAALVSGQAALIKAVRPRMKATRVATIIEATGRAVGSGEARTTKVDVFGSVVRAQGVSSRPRAVRVQPRRRSALVRWQPARQTGRSEVRRYVIRLRQRSGEWRQAAVENGSATQAVVRGLRPSRPYEVRVVAVNDQGRGPGASVQFRTAE